MCVNIKNCYLNQINKPSNVIGSMCERGISFSAVLYSVIVFSTWQAEQKKIGKKDACICCTVSQTYGKRTGTAVSVFHAVPTCYTTQTSVGMWIPTECKCHIVVPWTLSIGNLSCSVGTLTVPCRRKCVFCASRE